MQNKVKEFNKIKNVSLKPMSPESRLMDIVSEVGELSKEVLKNTDYGTKAFSVSEDYIMEYGDVLYSLLSLADETGIDSNEALDKVLDKYRKRLLSKGDIGSGR